MFNNRMLAVAAVLVMAVPALGAATPIVVPPVPEQLVEGHTVFTVIEIVAATQTNEVRFAAAVAVLVREYQARNVAQRFPGVLWFNDQYLTNPYQNENDFQRFRYPCGGAVMAVNAGDPDPRVVIADLTLRSTTLEADIPDPVDDQTGDVSRTVGGVSRTEGDDTETYNDPPWKKPYPGTYTYENDPAYSGGHDYAWVGADVGPSTVNATNPSADAPFYAWSDTVVGSISGSLGMGDLEEDFPWDYRESYLITDPNDHSWVIDVYDFYTRYGATGNANDLANAETFGPEEVWGPNTAVNHPNRNGDNNGDGFQDYNDPTVMPPPEGPWTQYGAPPADTYTWPVWVVNTLGSPVFIPDYGRTVLTSGRDYIGESCVPFRDLIEGVAAPLDGAFCGVNVPNLISDGEGADNEITVNPYNGAPPWTDDPCMSYQEPSRNGYCYGGQEDIGVGCPHGDTGNGCRISDRNEAYADSLCTVNNNPYRQYNALLYFHLEDLRIWDGTTRDHCGYDPTLDTDPEDPNNPLGGCNPALTTDTNGCSEEQYTWGPNPPQAAYDWPCPFADDNREGNSHPFHPLAPPHEEAEECMPQWTGSRLDGTDARRRNPANHGGSSYITPQHSDVNGWYQVYAPCDYAHTTRNIDIYFSPAGRPFPPPVRNFDVLDLEGSSAPFQDYHMSYPGTP